MSAFDPPPTPPIDPVNQRLTSLDVYRGLIMTSLAFEGFGLAATAQRHLDAQPSSGFWQAVRYQFSHVEWVGCAYWDLIQPSFMFMVGVSMAFSFGKRAQVGESYTWMFFHAVRRSLILIFLGIFLISNSADSTNWSLMNVLTQIGLGYIFLFLLWGRGYVVQALAAIAILGGTWYLYTSHATSGIDLEQGRPALGVTAEWAQQHLTGIPPVWHKNANVGHAIDVRLLNWLPTRKPFVFNSGGYQTINFIPSLATMLFGLMAGELLRGRLMPRTKVMVLLAAGALGLAAGWLLAEQGFSPLVKRIWTPSWTLFSTGWCCLILAALYTLIDVWQFRAGMFPLVVVGVNSIAIYSMSMLLKPWTSRTLKTHFGSDVFLLLGPMNEPMVQACLVGLVFWLVCWWLYRQSLHIRI